MMVDPNQESVAWRYLDRLPDVPFYILFHPCPCGREIRVEAIEVDSVRGRELHQSYLRREMNNVIEQPALNRNLEQNNRYPQQNRYQDGYNSNDEYEEIGEEGNENHEARRNWQNRWRERNILAPLLDYYLAHPEGRFEDESIEEYAARRDFAMARGDYIRPGFNSDNDEDIDR